MKSKKITLEELKAKTIRVVSLSIMKTELRYEDRQRDERIIVTQDSIHYRKKAGLVDDEDYLSRFDLFWNLECESPKLESLIEKYFAAIKAIITDEKLSKELYSDCCGTTISVAFTDDTTFDVCYFVPRYKFRTIASMIEKMIPQGVPMPLICQDAYVGEEEE